MKGICKFLVILTSGLFLAGCSQAPVENPKVTELSNTVSNLTRIVEFFANQQSNATIVNSNALIKLEQQIWDERIKDSQYYRISVDPDNQGYQIFHSPVTTVLVNTKSVSPYMDGFKITMEIGNLSTADLNGFELKYSIFDPTNFTSVSFTNQITTLLKPGCWTPFDFVVAPATPQQIRNTSVFFSFSQVQLLKTK